MARGTVRFWAAARAAAGVAEEPFEADNLDDLVAEITRRHGGSDLPRVLGRSSFLVDGRPAGTRDRRAVELPEGATVEVLPPFAGG
ncbi:thiamine biosynthesis protein ThiS [Sphaerisporangium krabiense]|uniref:Molybdopterin converting factor small subunit n=1 Tax=Sphaerisporangium krabiense TaxID=763782 RepID=A0A7W8Z0G4_9ACTN|nr:MoaD/ThiS family protein [Sphaerisporangium krabiense]MBB5625115.1 molybdopterin converting factor small subunit [Sphaerisporangium krabiense]GII67286.1 thiamine biosynthesis protein ThiS [Sphaerisporangium krabiense]